MTDPQVRELARRIHELEQRIATLGRARQLDVSSIPVTVDGDEGPETVDVPLASGVSRGVQAWDQSVYAIELAEQLETELGPLPGQIQAALDDAQSALTEAGLARSDAAAAVEDAQQAAADASQAISDALAAANAASDAQNTANAAQSAAGDAQDAADQAAADALLASGAASAADTKATNAASAAATADGKAEAAQSAANAKGKVIIQSAAPAAADRLPQNLWIDTTGGANTPKRWVSGATWEVVTDKAASDAAAAAVAAQNRADDAFDEATAAATAAGNAQTAANGKNTVWYQASAPTGSGHKVNDVWFDTDNGNRVSRWNGTTWSETVFGTAAIANLAITNALISSLDAAKITTGELDAARIAALSITAGKLAANSVVAEKIAADAVTSAKILADAVTAVKIAANAVTAEKINAGAVTTVKLDALAVTAEKIAAGAIIADKIAANAITTAKLAADAIDGMTITGALIRTAPTGQRLQLEVGGLRAFNASNQVTAAIAASTGGLSISGSTVWRDSNFSNDWGQLLISPATASQPHMIDLQRDGVHAQLTLMQPTESYPGAALLRSTAGHDLYLQGGRDVWVNGVDKIVLDAPTVQFRGDTDWIQLDGWTGGFAHGSGSPVRYRRRRGYVEIMGSLTNGSWSGNYTSFGASMPAGFRPPQNIDFTMAANSTVVRTVQFRPDGGIYLYGNVNSGAWWNFMARYPID